MRYGEVIKYKEICELMGDNPVQGGKSRKTQLNKWGKLYEIEKVNRGYIIHRKYTEEEVEFLSIENKFSQSHIGFNIPYKDRHKSGVYIIKLDNMIYIGETIDFLNRYKSHKMAAINENYGVTGSKIIISGGNMEILEIIDGADSTKRKEIEQKYIKFYSSIPCIKCLNKDFNYGGKRKPNRMKSIKINSSEYEKVKEILEKAGIYYE